MKTVKYAFFTCTFAYLLAVTLLFIFFAEQAGWSRIDNGIVTSSLSGLTLALSEFEWWGDFYYLAFLVPWLSSSLVMIFLMQQFKGGAGQRRIFGGLSIFAYYFVMFMVFIIRGLAFGWGDIGYDLLWLWPVVGFGLGYLAAIMAEKLLKPRFWIDSQNAA